VGVGQGWVEEPHETRNALQLLGELLTNRVVLNDCGNQLGCPPPDRLVVVF
jgi:hypothetical protein